MTVGDLREMLFKAHEDDLVFIFSDGRFIAPCEKDSGIIQLNEPSDANGNPVSGEPIDAFCLFECTHGNDQPVEVNIDKILN